MQVQMKQKRLWIGWKSTDYHTDVLSGSKEVGKVSNPRVCREGAVSPRSWAFLRMRSSSVTSFYVEECPVATQEGGSHCQN